MAIDSDHAGRVVPATQNDLGQRPILASDRHQSDVTIRSSLEFDRDRTVVDWRKVVLETVFGFQLRPIWMCGGGVQEALIERIY